MTRRASVAEQENAATHIFVRKAAIKIMSLFGAVRPSVLMADETLALGFVEIDPGNIFLHTFNCLHIYHKIAN